jgi:hypothetical protein
MRGWFRVNAMLSAARKLLASTLTWRMTAAILFTLAEHLRDRVRHGQECSGRGPAADKAGLLLPSEKTASSGCGHATHPSNAAR